MVALDRELDNAEVAALRGLLEHHAPADLECVAATQATNVVENTQRDVRRMARAALRPATVWDAAATARWFPARASTATTALTELDLDLHVTLAHAAL
jgi:hypothetical protein